MVTFIKKNNLPNVAYYYHCENRSVKKLRKYLEAPSSFPFFTSNFGFLELQEDILWFCRNFIGNTLESNAEKPDGQSPETAAVLEAIVRTLEAIGSEYEKPCLKENSLNVINKIDGQSYDIDQLSNGYKTVLAMVIGLSRRIVQINHKCKFITKKNYLNTPAIVLMMILKNICILPGSKQLSPLLWIFSPTLNSS
jgi:predicted ATP-binding protein involved in virulence